jgi:predicted nucleic acid-binding Zn ribbon protein
VQDIDLLAIDDLEQGRQRGRIELGLVEVADVNAKRIERLFRQVPLPQADKRHLEALRIEARDHPRKEALDAVHARSLPAKVVANLEYS